MQYEKALSNSIIASAIDQCWCKAWTELLTSLSPCNPLSELLHFQTLEFFHGVSLPSPPLMNTVILIQASQMYPRPRGGCDSALSCCTCWLPGADRHWVGIVVVSIAVASLPITSGCWESSWWGKPLYHYGNVSGGKWMLLEEPTRSESIWLGTELGGRAFGRKMI